MTAQKKSRFDELLETEHYQKLLGQLSDDEREAVIKSLRKLVKDFEHNVIEPLKILKQK